jgi:hypothetical protein
VRSAPINVGLFERLFDEIHRAGLHGPHRKAHIAMAGDDDHRQHDAAIAQELLHRQPIDAAQPHIEQHAARRQTARHLQKGFARFKAFNLHAGGLQHELIDRRTASSSSTR